MIEWDSFVNGAVDNDGNYYLVLEIGGTGVPVSFDVCCSSTSIELKFVQFLEDENSADLRHSPCEEDF